MEITFFGACHEVTGSCHLITANQSRIMLDCGLFQGNRKKSAEKNADFSFDAGSITNLLLSHAHIDHSGRIPMLSAKGFNGRVITTRATQDACEFMLRDSAHIQEQDAYYLNYKTARAFLYNESNSGGNNRHLDNKELRQIKKILKKDRRSLNQAKIAEIINNNNLQMVTPLYTIDEAVESLKQFEGYPYDTTIEIGKDMFCTFYDAGHILGSAITILEIKENSRQYTIGFSGDLGRFHVPILRDPTLKFPAKHQHLDLMIMESTYGNRFHEPVGNLSDQLAEVINKTYERGGSVVIPSFAMERTQTLIYMLHELYNEKKLPSIPVYVDSPLALNLTTVFGEHPECYDSETHQTFLKNSENPFSFNNLKYIQSVEESMELNRDKTPHIVISASGMCESGRILHHLRFRIHDSRNTVLFVGYQAQNTLGRRIIELSKTHKEKGGDYPLVKFMHKQYPIKADVVQMDGFSGHADQSEIIKFLTESNLKIDNIALVHGEEESIETLGQILSQKGFPVFIPNPGESFPLKP